MLPILGAHQRATVNPLPSGSAQAAAAVPTQSPTITDQAVIAPASTNLSPAGSPVHPHVSFTYQEKLKDADFFQEQKTDFAPIALPATAQSAALAPNQAFFSGQSGRLLAARFVGRDARTDGDFRYASGKPEFQAWMQADEALQKIPPGQLGGSLTPELLQNLDNLSSVSQLGSFSGSAGYLVRPQETVAKGNPKTARQHQGWAGRPEERSV